ncbi:hypothetical protein ACH347_29015 [Saccharopolyspora sp. 5N102]|uniref:hypothetical protein n=1 Tax=Saccharopolyspora sp. 5N102 TaxID=3375155 RepID=UPI0037A26564
MSEHPQPPIMGLSCYQSARAGQRGGGNPVPRVKPPNALVRVPDGPERARLAVDYVGQR